MSAFLAPIARALADAFRPLREGFADHGEAEAYFARHGWDVALPDTTDLGVLRQAFALAEAELMLGLLDEFINGTGRDVVSVTLDLLQAAKALAQSISSLDQGQAGLPSPLNSDAIWKDLAQQIPDDLVAAYLETHQPLIHAALHIATIIRYERQDWCGTLPADRIRYTRTTIAWGNLGQALTDPGQLLANHYGWGGATFHHQRLFRALERSMLAFGLRAAVQPPRPTLITHIDSGQIEPQLLYELEIPIIDGERASERLWWKLGLVLLPIPASPPVQGSPTPATGILIKPVLRGAASIDMAFSHDIRFKIAANADATSTLSASIFPSGASVTTDPGAATVAFRAEVTGRPEKPYLLFGARDSHRLELDGFVAEVGVEGAVDDPEVYARIATGGASKLRLVVDFGGGDGDGFVKKLMAAQEKIQVEIGAGLLWSSRKGLSFEGSAAIDFVKHIHLQLGPVSVETLHVKAAAAAAGGVHLDFGVGLKGSFGPVTMVVEDIGLRMKLKPDGGGGGAFGDLDLDFGFKPPSGVGIAIDAGAIKGGGYLYFDFDKEEYAGALEFELAGYIRLTAIGILTTRLPDGSKGFSLLIILTAEFASGIQIGMGFSLLGVGGLLGLNRTMVLQELVEGVRSGAINGIMFPKNIVANAPRIISDLKAMFPPKKDVFLVGPMAKLGWGAPPLVTLSLGVIIEIPGNIAIVGMLKLCLPNADSPVLVLQANFVGAIEFDKSRLYFFAALFDSRILSMTLGGELGVLVQWGDRPNFVFSAGGFHPGFAAPALPFPMPARISLNILNQSNARIRVMSYFAVTSNTAQLGARADMYFGFSKCSVEGFIGFDALFQFSPFRFVIEAGASLAARVFNKGLFSVNVHVTLHGPAPWSVNGAGTVSLALFDIDFDFSRTWGESRSQAQQDISLLGLIAAELNKDESWSAVVPEAANLLVSLRKTDPSATTLLLHPLGRLRVSQKRVPLQLGIDRIGTQPSADVSRATLAVTGGGFAKTGDAIEKFAMAQYMAMDDAAKLSRPSFEDGFGGIELASAGDDLACPEAVVRTVRYEVSVLDSGFRHDRWNGATLSAATYDHFAQNGFIANSRLSASNQAAGPSVQGVNVKSLDWAVAWQADNKPVSAAALLFPSETMAIDHMNQQVAANAGAGPPMHVIAAYELVQ